MAGNFGVSFDNLKFKMKFAKALNSTTGGVKKMLNLITGQVTMRMGNIQDNVGTDELSGLAKAAMRRT